VATYEVRISGDVPPDVVDRLVADVVATGQETRTVITASFVDQADLQGFLQRVRAFGLELVELRAVDRPRPSSDGGA